MASAEEAVKDENERWKWYTDLINRNLGYLMLKASPTGTPRQSRYMYTKQYPFNYHRPPIGFFATGLIQLTATLMPMTMAPMM